MLPLRVRVDLGTMAMKRYSKFPKSPRLESHHQIIKCHNQDTRWREESQWEKWMNILSADSQMRLRKLAEDLSGYNLKEFSFIVISFTISWRHTVRKYINVQPHGWAVYRSRENLLLAYTQVRSSGRWWPEIRVGRGSQESVLLKWPDIKAVVS